MKSSVIQNRQRDRRDESRRFGGGPLALHLLGAGTVAMLILGYYKGQSRKVQTLVDKRQTMEAKLYGIP